ncbi:MAG TPA: HD domain-containing phosphohydrolase [Thermoanaerobaculia bacterium]|jgi:putative two-component system response regulator
MDAPRSLISRIPPPDDDAGRVFVVDDDEQVRGLMRRLLRRSGYVVEEFGVGATALAAIRERPPDLVLLDLMLPDASGNDVLAEIRDNPSTRLLPVVMMTGHGTRDDRLRAQRTGVTDFLAKPVAADELLPRVRSLVQLKHFADEHEHAERVILMLAKTIDARDSYTAGHSGRVAQYACDVAAKMNWKASEIEDIRRGALFHDIGKIVVSDSVLKKVGPLTAEERLTINQHPVVGCELLSGMKTMRAILPIIYHHHERLDGSGYPDGISGKDIPLAVRTVSVADVFDALTTNRAYRPAMTFEQAWKEIDDEVARGLLDPDPVNALKEVVAVTGIRRDPGSAPPVSGLFRF